MTEFRSEKHHENVIIFRDGRPLCSIRDPQSEAEKWCRLFKLDHKSSVSVLGVGAGFHILELLKENQQKVMWCFEIHVELKEFFYQTFPDLKGRVQIITPEDKDLPIYDLALQSAGDLYRFLPAWQGYEPQYQEFEKKILGRGKEDLIRHLQASGLFLTEMQLNELNSETEVSIKKLVTQLKGFSQEEEIWRALREMVE